MSIVRAARDDAPASHLPSPAVAVPQPRRSEPAAALPGNPPSAARTASAAASSCSGRAARSGSVGAPAAPGPARPATPSRQHVRAVLTGSPRSARSAPRLRIVRPSDQPAAYRSPATTRPGITQPSDRPGQPPAQPGQPAVHAPAQPAQVPVGAGQVPARSARVSAQPGQAQSRPGAARPGVARTGAARSSAATPRSLQLTAARPHPARPSGLRLTRRGRLVLSVFALALILGLITILWATLANGVQAASGRSHTGSVYQGLHRVTVLPGQTLWAIAQRAEPSADPRTVIPEIMQINAISSTDLQPGQQLWVPGS